MSIEKGIQKKYIISRLDGTPINPENKYFILKVDGIGDPEHILASRKAILEYAKAIEHHIPELAKDIFKTYS